MYSLVPLCIDIKCNLIGDYEKVWFFNVIAPLVRYLAILIIVFNSTLCCLGNLFINDS